MGVIAEPVLSASRADHARATMTALTSSPDVYEAFFEQAQIGLALADLSSRYVRVNPAYAALLGRVPEDLIGVPFATVLQPVDVAEGRMTLALQSGDRALQAEERLVTPDGGVRWVLHGVTVVPGPDGQPGWFAVSAQDITERRRAEEELRTLTTTLTTQASHDPLTGLANRSAFEERLTASLSRDARTGARTAVLFLDLDGFKAVNDEHGHAVGDALLRAVADRLAGGVRPSDVVARIGGDEFVVLVEAAEPGAVDLLARRLQDLVGRPVAIDGLDLEVGVSIGRAFAEAGEPGAAPLLVAADKDMYAVKRARNGRVVAPRTATL